METDSARILVVEDNYADYRLIQEYLRENPPCTCSLVRAQSIAEALALIGAERFSLVILDLILPDADGMSGLEKITRSDPLLPVIVITGVDSEETGLLALSMRAQDYLAKGKFTSEMLARSIRYSMERVKADATIHLLNKELRENLATLERSRKAALNLLEDSAAARHEAMAEKNRLEAVMEALPVGAAILNENGGSLHSNPMFGTIWGWDAPAVKSIDDYAQYQAWSTDTGEPIKPEEWASAVSTRTGKPVIGQILRIKRFDGAIAYVINSAAPVRDRSGAIIGSAVTIQDITRLRETEEALMRSAARFQLLADTAQELLRDSDPQKLIESLCTRVMLHLDCQVFFNFLAHERTKRLRLNACAGISEEEARRIEWLDYGVAVCGCAARDACRIVAERIATTPDIRTELVKSYGVQAYACHPLFGEDGAVVGTLSFGTKNRETFTEEELSLMKAVADQASIAMMRRNQDTALRESQRDLDRAQAVSHTGSWRLNVEQNELTWSGENYRIFGVPERTPMTYELFLKIVHPDDRAFVDRMWKAAMRGAPYDIEHRIVINGETRWVREVAELEYNRDGVIVSGFGTTQDITERMRAGEDVRNTLSATTDGIWKRYPETGEMYFSPRYYAMLGYEPDEFPASLEAWTSLIHPDDYSRAMAVHAAFESGESDLYVNEFRMRCKNGEYRLIRSRGKVVQRDPGGNRLQIIGNHEDITDERASERMVAETSQLLAAIVDNTSLLIVYLANDFTIIWVNRAFAAFHREDAPSFPGKNLFDLYPGERTREQLHKAAAAGAPLYQKAITHTAPGGGKTFWDWSLIPILNPDGTTQGIVLTMVDMTDHKHIEEELIHFSERLEKQVRERTAELSVINENLKNEIARRQLLEAEKEKAYQELDVIFNSITVGMTVVDRDFTIMRMNKRFMEMYECDSSVIGARKCHEVWTSDRCGTERCPMHAILSGTPVMEYELRRTNAAGKELVLQVSATPFYSATGEIIGMIRNVIDITEMREIQRTLTSIIDDERRKISHELHDGLGQDLTAIAFLIEFIRQRTDSHALAVRNKLEEASGIIQYAQSRTRAISRLLSPVDMKQNGFASSLEELAAYLERIYDVRCAVTVEGEIAISDNTVATNLYYVVREAMHNAIKHANPKNIIIRVVGDKGGLSITVSDDGTATPEALKGDGMGLKIMRHRAELAGAVFWKTVTDTGGLSIDVYLPPA